MTKINDAEMMEVIPKQTDEVLLNPGMGLYLQAGPKFGFKPHKNEWFMKICDIAYYRLTWSRLQPEEGKLLFPQYFGPIFDFWVKQHGKRVAFRVMSESMHFRGKYATPKWVFEEKGVPGVKHIGIYGQDQIDPVFWDEKYVKVHEKFIQALGRYLDGKEGLEFIDIGSIGEWGEMHLGFHIPGRWTKKQLEETGYTETKYIQAYRRIIDKFMRVFPNTQVFLNVGAYATINDYAAISGIHFRQDGLTPSGPSENVGKRFFHPYSKRGIKCNYEFHSTYPEMKKEGWDLWTTIKKALEDPISYLNSNLYAIWELEKAPIEVKQALIFAASKIGFRFVPIKLKVQKRVYLKGKNCGRLIIGHTWKNIGVAPCYKSYALEFALTNNFGNAVVESLNFPEPPTTLWWPGKEIVVQTTIRVPLSTPPGKYRLKLSVSLPEKPNRKILLGIEGKDAQGRYDICEIECIKG